MEEHLILEETYYWIPCLSDEDIEELKRKDRARDDKA